MTCFKDLDFHLFIESLIRTIEIKDMYTAGHSRRVSEIAELMCKGLRMSDQHCDYLHVVGHLHDIGKIGIAEGILMKSGKLSKAEYCVFRTKTASVPAGIRPPFRWENGQRSDWNAATIPVKTASTN